MIIDDSIIKMYLNDIDTNQYSNHWIYTAVRKGVNLFVSPNTNEKEWISLLQDKVTNDAENLIPRNRRLISKLFPAFEKVSQESPIILTVGFRDPYDAMVLENNKQMYVVFDLMQFVEYVRDLYEQGEAYGFRRILTHELLHVCIKERYPRPKNLSYIQELSYIAFDEGFAHALSYQEDMMISKFDKILQNKFKIVKEMLAFAIDEKDNIKQEEFKIMADSGNYWDKFASIAGKLYILKNKDTIEDIYSDGWDNFANKIICSD